MSFVVGDDFAAGRRGGMEVRGTKYEVKELGATELRREVGRRQSRNDARGINQSAREDDTPVVCEAMKRCSRGTGINHA